MQGRAVMRRVMTLCGLVVVFALGTDAQVRPQNSLFLGSSFPAIAAAFPSAGPAAIPAPTPEPAPADPQGIYGVIQNFNFQISGGFTYMRFYEIPNTTGDLDGFNISLVYYPRGGHWGVDGEFVAAFAPQNGVTTTLDAGMGGGRFRFIKGSGSEIWVHALVGGAHFSPQMPYGSESALASEAGAGIDLAPPHRRAAVRIEADALGTYFFGTYQVSPKVSVGLVYKF
ncbi:MAG TPA: hypothetical protein VMM16_05745 [Verrucomicrobiae bacterium]|nr:hypothetical protein [Verrucomicrobiae bacterium]